MAGHPSPRSKNRFAASASQVRRLDEGSGSIVLEEFFSQLLHPTLFNIACCTEKGEFSAYRKFFHTSWPRQTLRDPQTQDRWYKVEESTKLVLSPRQLHWSKGLKTKKEQGRFFHPMFRVSALGSKHVLSRLLTLSDLVST